jgi:hypothetical protein
MFIGRRGSKKDIPRREKRRAYDLPLKICLEFRIL